MARNPLLPMTPEVLRNQTGMQSSGRTVLAVVVTYRPDTAVLTDLLRELLAQADQVLIVDNTPAHDDRVHAALADFPEIAGTLRLVRLGSNLGIAAALNIGIQAAIAEHFDYVLLSDQDSLPASDMLAQLLAVAHRLLATGVRLGSVSPAYVDHVTGQMFSFQVQEPGRAFYRSLPGDCADPWVEVITQISSGSLIPCSVFAEVGFMREDYFIDYVDSEWCHRARHHGHQLYGTSLAAMGHRMGDATFPVWYLRWRPFTAYAPQRLYYRFRNFALLMRCDYVPWRWKVRASWYWLGNIYAYLLFSRRRMQNAKFIVRGLWDGLRGRTGFLAGVDSL